MKKRKILDLTYVAMGAAIMATCSFIAIPGTVPVTMQTFAVLLVSTVLGLKRGIISVAVYLLLGATGLPVFSNFSGGLGHLLGTSGGYLFGFLATSLTLGLLMKTKIPIWLSMAFGVAADYVCGVLWYVVMFSSVENIIGILSISVFPFVPFEIVKIAAAYLTAKSIKDSAVIK